MMAASNDIGLMRFLQNLSVLANVRESDRVEVIDGVAHIIPSGWTQAVMRSWRGSTRVRDVAAIQAIFREGHERVQQAVNAYCAAKRAPLSAVALSRVMDTAEALSVARTLCSRLTAALDGLDALRSTYQADPDITTLLENQAATSRRVVSDAYARMSESASSAYAALGGGGFDDDQSPPAPGREVNYNPWFSRAPRKWASSSQQQQGGAPGGAPKGKSGISRIIN